MVVKCLESGISEIISDISNYFNKNMLSIQLKAMIVLMAIPTPSFSG